METRVEKIETEGGYVTAATMIINGKEFTAGGDCEYLDKQGRKCVGLYVDTDKMTASNWIGTETRPVHLRKRWKSNMRDWRCSLYIRKNGKDYWGILYNEDFNQYVTFRECKK